MKKILSFILALSMIICVLPCSAIHATAQISSDGKFSYSVSNEEITIIEYVDKKVSGAFSIPDSIETYPVTKIANFCFSGCALSSISIPDNVEYIGDVAFENCSQLNNITIGAGVEHIGTHVFTEAPNLSIIDVSSDNVYYKSVEGVLYNYDLTELLAYPLGKTDSHFAVPDSVSSVTAYAFTGALHLKSLSIGTGMKIISDRAFIGAANVESVILEGNVTEIGPNAFGNMNKLSSINLPDTLRTISKEAFQADNALKELSIPYSVNYIDENAFEGTAADFLVYCHTNSYTADYCETHYIGYEPVDNFCFTQYVQGQEPTCTQGGLAHYICEVCGAEKTDNIEALGHQPVDDVWDEPTCTQSGCKDIICDRCGILLQSDVVVPALGHISNYYNVYQEATCTETGLGNGVCTRCAVAFDAVLPALGHKPVDQILEAPTCTEKGIKNVKCERCEVMLEEEAEAPALGHAYLQQITEATCTAQGYTTYTCSRCQDLYISDYTEALGHSVKQVITPATLNNDGVIKEVCSACGEVIEQTIIYRPNVDEIVIKPHDDIWETGSFTYTGEAIVPEVIVYDTMGVQLANATDYIITLSGNVNVGKAKVTIRFKGNYTGSYIKQFTILPPGISISKLIGGNKSVTVSVDFGEIPMLDGYQIQYSTNAAFTEAKTVTVKDLETITYSVKMLENYTDYYFRVRAYKTIAETNYFSDWSSSKKIRTKCSHENYEIVKSFVENECLGGEILVNCLDCEQEVTLYQDGLGHLPQSIAAVAPTCAQVGLSEGEMCARCGEILMQQEEIPALGHTWSSWQIISAPSCEKTGLSMRICNTCNQIDTLVIPVLVHSFSAVNVEATCTHPGYTTYTCVDCGYSYIGDYVPKAEHHYIDTVTEPTTEAQGYTVHTCKDCGYYYIDSLTDILPSQMHYIIPSLADINTTLTIKSDENEYSVTAENGVFKIENIKSDIYRVYAKYEHSLLACIGEYDTKAGEYINNDALIPLGNVNDDDTIDIADVSLLLQSDIFTTENADYDLNKDGIIDIADISIILSARNYGKTSVEIM